MIRVLHVVFNMNRGGLETFLMNIYRDIDRSRIQFDFLVHTESKSAYDDEIRSLGGHIYAIPPRSQGVLKNKKALAHFFAAHKEFAVVHQHVSSLSYIEPLKAAKRYKVPVRLVHGHSTRQLGKFHKYLHLWNQININRYATVFFACSDLAAKWLYGENAYEKGRCRLINNGIDTSKFCYNGKKREEMRKQLNIEDKYVIGHVGRFSYPKNHEFLINLFKKIHDEREDAVLLLVGDGELRSSMEALCKNLGLQDSTVFMGLRTDIDAIMEAMDVFVFPSHFEGLPVTLIEAQASGLPCVISDHITGQVELTDLVTSISLNRPMDDWVRTILNTPIHNNRTGYSKIIESRGFDSKMTARELCEFYTRVVEEI